MNRDHRIYRRSTLLQFKEGDPDWEAWIDSLEVTSGGGKDERFQLITNGLQLPACSFVSRTSDDIWYLDTGVDFDGGRMYVGERDFSGMASVAGYVSKATVGRVYEENERLSRDLAIAKSLIDSLRNSIAELVGAPSVEGSSIPRARKPAGTNESATLGDEADSENLDLDLK